MDQGKCLDDHAEWAGTCVKCTTWDADVIVLFLFLTCLYTLLSHRLSQQSNGRTKILYAHCVVACT